MRTFAMVSIATLLFAACGGGAPSPTQPGAPTNGGQPTSEPVGPTQAPPIGGESTVVVILSGGPDAGTYNGTGDPRCTHGFIGEDAWGVQYSEASAGEGELSSVQLIAPPSGEVVMNTRFRVTVTIGVLFEGNDYDINLGAEDDDSEASGTGSAEVTDNGSTAQIRVTGTTADGVGLDVTVNCPQVTRG